MRPVAPLAKPISRAVRLAADHHREAPSDIGRDAGNRHGGEMRRPVALRIDAGDRAAPAAMAVLIGDQARCAAPCPKPPAVAASRLVRTDSPAPYRTFSP